MDSFLVIIPIRVINILYYERRMLLAHKVER